MFDKGNGTQEVAKPQKKRVLFVITQSEIGGAQQFLVQLLSHLNTDKFQWAVGGGADGSHELQKLLPPETPYFTALALRRNPNLFSDIRSVFQLRRIYKNWRPDILFLMSSKTGFIGALAARLINKWQLVNGKKQTRPTVIYRIGGWTFNDPWPRWKKVMYRMLEKMSARWKDYIIVNNSYDLRLAQHYRIRPRRKLLLIYNGIDPYMNFLPREKARQDILELMKKNGSVPDEELLSGKRLIGTIANFYPSKDVTTLVRAATQFLDNTLTGIIGDGPLRNEIKTEIQRLNLEKRVFLLGTIPDAKRYLPAFDVFVLVSRKEGFPWVILEAMAAKVPAVATNIGAIPEIIENGKNGLTVPTGAPDQIAQAVKTLLDDDALRRKMAIQAHQTIVKDFSLNEMISAYDRLLSQL